MTNKKLISMGAIAIVLGGMAYITSSRNKVATPTLVGQPVIKNLSLSEVKQVEISGEKPITLTSGDNGWVISSLYNFPADITKIRENLLKLTDLKIGHVATGKSLDSPTLVDLQGEGGRSITTVRLGEKHFRENAANPMAQFGSSSYPDGRYISAGNNDDVYLVNDTMDPFDGDPRNWCDTKITSIQATDIKAIHMTSDDDTMQFDRTDGKLTMRGLGEKEEFDSSKSWTVEGALGHLNFNNIADPALTNEEIGINTGAVYTVMLNSGEVYTAKIGNQLPDTSDRYLRINASFNPVGTNEVENAATTAKVEEFNANTGKWIFTIPSYNADNMRKKRADLVKPKEEPAADDATTTDQE